MNQVVAAFHRLKRFDERRASIPGEHWAAFGAGAALLACARRTRSPLLRTAALAAGGAMIWRAASGRDSPVQRLRARLLQDSQ